jgi:hypothetical protein
VPAADLEREALATAGAAAVGSTLGAGGASLHAQEQEKAVKKGRLKQSVCRWCYQRIPLEEFCRGVAAIGLTAIDLLQPEEWEVAAKYGLICSTGFPGKGGGSIPDGLNNRMLHDTIVKTFETALPKAKLDALKKDPQAARELLLNLMVKQDLSPGNLPFAGKLQTLGDGMLTASQAKAPESDTDPLGLASVNGAMVLKRIPVSRGRRIYLLDKVVFAEKTAAKSAK